MGHQLQISSEDACILAERLAELTGESVESAVTTAIQQRLEREEAARNRQARILKVRRLAAEIRELLGEPLPTSNHDHLYDERGLPR
jgi:hypothetical protein